MPPGRKCFTIGSDPGEYLKANIATNVIIELKEVTFCVQV